MALDISNHLPYLDPNIKMKTDKSSPSKCHFRALPKCSWNSTKNELTLGPGELQICIVQPHIQTATASDNNSPDMKHSNTIQKHHYVDATIQDVLIRRFVLFCNGPKSYIIPAFNSTVLSIDASSLYYLHILFHRINIRTHFLYTCYRYIDILLERHKFADESEPRLQDMIKMFKEEELLSSTNSLGHHTDTKKNYRKKRKQEKRNSMTKTYPTKSKCLERMCLVRTCLG